MTARALSSSRSARLNALKKKHAILSTRLEDAQKSPSTNDFFLRQIKKEKLVLKEQIEGIRASENASA